MACIYSDSVPPPFSFFGENKTRWYNIRCPYLATAESWTVDDTQTMKVGQLGFAALFREKCYDFYESSRGLLYNAVLKYISCLPLQSHHYFGVVAPINHFTPIKST